VLQCSRQIELDLSHDQLHPLVKQAAPPGGFKLLDEEQPCRPFRFPRELGVISDLNPTAGGVAGWLQVFGRGAAVPRRTRAHGLPRGPAVHPGAASPHPAAGAASAGPGTAAARPPGNCTPGGCSVVRRLLPLLHSATSSGTVAPSLRSLGCLGHRSRHRNATHGCSFRAHGGLQHTKTVLAPCTAILVLRIVDPRARSPPCATSPLAQGILRAGQRPIHVCTTAPLCGALQDRQAAACGALLHAPPTR